MDKPIPEAVVHAFVDWLAKEMPSGTYITSPQWWASRIIRQIEFLTAAQQQGQAQGGGEVVAWMTPGGDVSRSFYWCLERCLPGQEPQPLYTAPPSAPVGVDKETERRLIDVAASMLNDNNGKIGKKHFRADATAVVRRVLKALAQQPAAVDEALSHADLCRLSRVFNAHNVPGLDQDRRINEWLGKRIAAALATQHQEPTTPP